MHIKRIYEDIYNIQSRILRFFSYLEKYVFRINIHSLYSSVSFDETSIRERDRRSEIIHVQCVRSGTNLGSVFSHDSNLIGVSALS